MVACYQVARIYFLHSAVLQRVQLLEAVNVMRGELTVNFELDGPILCQEIDTVFCPKGGWSTMIVGYQERDRKTEEFGPDKFSIRRYQKRNGEYQYKSKFNISSRDQATKVVNALNSWLADEPETKEEKTK